MTFFKSRVQQISQLLANSSFAKYCRHSFYVFCVAPENLTLRQQEQEDDNKQLPIRLMALSHQPLCQPLNLQTLGALP